MKIDVTRHSQILYGRGRMIRLQRVDTSGPVEAWTEIMNTANTVRMGTTIRATTWLFGMTIALGLGLLAMALVAGMARADSGSDPATLSFRADLGGDQEVPPVVTDTTGRAEVKVNEDMTMADFEVRVNDGHAVTAAHLHCAPVGVDGPVIAFLFGDIPGGFDVNGDLAQFALTDANILPAGASCSVPVHDIASLTEALGAGIIYANVHSVANPGGEIRGQLMED